MMARYNLLSYHEVPPAPSFKEEDKNIFQTLIFVNNVGGAKNDKHLYQIWRRHQKYDT